MKSFVFYHVLVLGSAKADPGTGRLPRKGYTWRKSETSEEFCEGRSEPNADRRSAVMSGGCGRTELSIGEFILKVYLVRSKPFTTRRLRPGWLAKKSAGCKRPSYEIFTFARKTGNLEVFVKNSFKAYSPIRPQTAGRL